MDRREFYDALPNTFVSVDVDERNTTLTAETEVNNVKDKEPEHNLNLSNPSLKRLSGAQRRKLAIQAALKKGEPIRHRRRRPAYKTPDSSRRKGIYTHSGSSDSVGTFRKRSPDASLRGTTSNITRTDGNTPALHQTTKKRHDENTTDSKDVLTVTKLAIVPQNFPETGLTEEQSDEVQMALLHAIKPGPEGTGPSFNSCYFHKGAVILVCTGEETKSWVETVVPNLKPWEGASLKVGMANDLLQTVKVIMTTPKNLRMKSPEEILQLVKTQNAGLKTEYWHIINHAKNENGVTLILNIDETSLKSLKKSNMKACIGLWKASFRVLAAAASGKRDGTNTAHQPEAAAGKPIAH